MQPVSFLRTATGRGEQGADDYARLESSLRGGGRPRRGPGRYVALGLLLTAVAAVVVAVVVLTTSSASLRADGQALARVGMPLGGGTIEQVSVLGARDRLIPVTVRGNQIWPARPVAAHELVSIQVTVRRPGWASLLAGSTERLRTTMYAPSTALREHYLTLHHGSPIRLEFTRPVQVLAYGPIGAVRRHVLPAPQLTVSLPRTAEAGSMLVAAAPRPWESSQPAMVSWFPAGAAAASAVASPSPGSEITPHTPITLTFSKPISQALGGSMPAVTPAGGGDWHPLGTHTIEFRPAGYGYGLAADVTVALPSGVQLVGGAATGTATAGHWHVPAGSTLRLQQLLAQLGYLPLSWRPSGAAVGTDVRSQETAAVAPPAGRFHWRYPNVPAALKGFWAAGSPGVLTRGALMAFQNEHGLGTDGSPGPAVWKELIHTAATGKRSTFGYTFVMVSVAKQKLTLWHSGRVVMTTAVNTGIASAPTATGTYPVFEHIPVGTMSGTNPDGSHYNDPGIQYISYFNGGDALHAFTRAQYGFPQSLGCVEMATNSAGAVYPYTPIGTLVHVA